MNNMIRIKNSIKLAINSMKTNKGRTLLTILGMVIGVMSIVVVFSAGEGLKKLIIKQIESFGTDIIEIETRIPVGKNKMGNESHESAMSMAQGVRITTLTLKDVEDIKKIPNIDGGYGALMGQELATYGSKRKKASLFGVSADFINIDKSEINKGRFFTNAEDESLTKVVVLGAGIKEDLFGDSDAIGNYINLGKSKYRVIGIMKEKGAAMGMDFNRYIYLPVQTLQKKIMGIDYLMYTIYKLKNSEITDETVKEVKIILRENHDINNPDDIVGVDDFTVVTMEEMMKTVNSITKYVTGLLLAIVIVSLVVGGVGIMNIMYVIISERTFEIGLRKALGAKNKDIMWQFLMEAIIISILGAILGIILGILLSLLITFAANAYGLSSSFKIPIYALFISLIFAVSTGLLFGVFPAKKAAELNPITSFINKN